MTVDSRWRRALYPRFMFVTIVGGLGVYAYAGSRIPMDRLGEVALFFALCALAQRMPVSLFRNSSISVAFAVAFAALVYLGPAAAIVVQLGAGLVLCVTPYVKPPQKMLFNAGALPLQTGAGRRGLRRARRRGRRRPTSAWRWSRRRWSRSTVFVVANTRLLAVVIALETGSSVRAVWNAELPLAAAELRRRSGWSASGWRSRSRRSGWPAWPVFFIPLAMAWYSFKLYMAQTEEVRRRNQELQLTNAQLDLANSRLSQRVTELAALNRIGLSLNGSLDLGDVLGEILDSALQAGRRPRRPRSRWPTRRPAGSSVAASVGLPGRRRRGAAGRRTARPRARFGERREVVVGDAARGRARRAGRGRGAGRLVACRCASAARSAACSRSPSRPRTTSAPDERLLLSTLAEQAATAVHNARLYQEIEQGYLSTVQAMVQVIDARERYAAGPRRARARLRARGRPTSSAWTTAARRRSSWRRCSTTWGTSACRRRC